MKLLLLLILVSCGQQDYKRCYTKDEALMNCIVTRIGESGESNATAKMFCEPLFVIENCYQF